MATNELRPADHRRELFKRVTRFLDTVKKLDPVLAGEATKLQTRLKAPAKRRRSTTNAA